MISSLKYCCLFFFLLSSSIALSADVEIATQAYNTTLASARQEVVAEFRKLIQEAATSDDAERVTKLRKFSDLFESEDALYLVKGTKPIILKYLKARSTASKTLREEYANAIKEANNAMDFDTSEILTRDLSEQHLPTKTVSYKVAFKNAFMRHGDFLVKADFMVSDIWKFHGTWEEVAGLGHPSYTSIRPINWPQRYVDHYGFRVRVVTEQDSNAWKKHATWIKKPGLANSRTGISFRSLSHPDRYIRVRDNGEVWLDKIENSSKFRSQATFFVKSGLFRVR